MASTERTARAHEEYEYSITVGNQRGPAALGAADGRRGQPILVGPAHSNWGEWFKTFRKIPLPHRMGAFYVYTRASEHDPWEEKFCHKDTQEREEPELELQAYATIDSLRDGQAMVAQRQREVANLAVQDRQLVERIASGEATLAGIRTETAACRKILEDERARCAREMRALEDRLARETSAIEELLSSRREIAKAEEARIQASLNAATMDGVATRQQNMAMRQLFTAAEGELLESEAAAATAVSARRRNLQASALVFQNAVQTLETEKLEQIEGMMLAPDAPHRDTPGERIAKLVETKFKDATADDVIGTIGALVSMFRPAKPE